MHPSIAAWPFQHFYGGGIDNAPEVLTQRPPIAGFPWPSASCQVCFVDLGRSGFMVRDSSAVGGEGAGRSVSNSSEAAGLISVLRSCLVAGTSPGDVAIITGYSAQQALLHRLAFQHLGSVVTEQLRIDTVDGFQGSERELVLVSTVRANTHGEVGFMRDPRRINVLLTRARRGLIVFGDEHTLEGEAASWRPWLEWVRRLGAAIPAVALRLDLRLSPSPAVAGHEASSAVLPALASPAAAEPEEIPPPPGPPPGWLAQLPAVDAACLQIDPPASSPPMRSAEWETYEDPDSGRTWWWNPVSEEVRWESPI